MAEPLTREQILAEPIGRRLDGWIHEHVMGGDLTRAIPYYSDAIATAWGVLEHLGCFVHCWRSFQPDTPPWAVQFQKDGGPLVEAGAETAPLAICRAALLQVQEL